MSRLIRMLVTVVAASAFMAGTGLAAQGVRVEKVVEVPGASKQEVYQRALSWSEKYGTVTSADPNTGVIVTKGQIAYPSPSTDRILHTFQYNMKNRVMGNRNTITFEDVMLKAPTYYSPETTGAGSPITVTGGETKKLKTTKDVQSANRALNYVANNFSDSLMGRTDTAAPLIRCPECPTLTTSPGELKEHEKIHGHDGQGTMHEHDHR